MIELTASAVERIRKILEREHGEGLRVGLVGGGCSGFSYKLKVEQVPRPTDLVLERDGVRVYVDPKSLKLLEGMTLDYTETLLQSGFHFHNPQVKSSCSCGKSVGF